MPDIFEIAKACGVSIATVSRSLNGRGEVSAATREKVMEAARRLGYTPHPTARSLKLRRSRVLGLVISSFQTFESPILTEVMRGLGETVESLDYRLLICSLSKSTGGLSEPIEILMKHQVDGLFLFELNDKHHTDPLKTLKLPYILVNINSGDLPSVSSANVEGAMMAVNNLIDLGHRRIGHLKGPAGNLVAEDRFLGYRKALDRAHIPFDPALVVESPWSSYAQQSTMNEEKAAQILFSRDKGPTAVFCCTDLMALGVSRQARRWGWEIPRDLSLAAFDDTWAASACVPALTTVKQDPYEIGRRAAQLLSEEVERKLSKDPSPSTLAEPRQTIPVQLLERQSTAKPPAQAPKAPH